MVNCERKLGPNNLADCHAQQDTQYSGLISRGLTFPRLCLSHKSYKLWMITMIEQRLGCGLVALFLYIHLSVEASKLPRYLLQALMGIVWAHWIEFQWPAHLTTSQQLPHAAK